LDIDIVGTDEANAYTILVSSLNSGFVLELKLAVEYPGARSEADKGYQTSEQ